MISKSIALKTLNAALSTGGDYAEIYAEQTVNSSVSLDNGKVEVCSGGQTYGAGIRILKGLKSVYGYTSNLKENSLVDLANKLAAAFDGKREITVKEIKKNKVKVINKISEPLTEISAETKIKYLKEMDKAARDVDQRIVRVISNFINYKKDIEIYSAENEVGTLSTNTEERGRVVINAMAAESNGQIESWFEGPGRYEGWSWFTKELDVKELGKTAAEKAIMLLTAKECPSGRYPVVIGNGWGGVVFHEACGHSLEATSCAKKLSVFADSLGKQIASPIVSAIDDGSIPNEWGSNNIDSEGHPTQANQLIKDGICTGFLVDKFNGRRMNMEANGCSRRQSYRYEPTSRMSNTYICAGKDKAEDIIKDTKLGIYVKSFGGGSVSPTTGEFNFSASEAYILRDGKVCEPVKGCTLIGSGKEVLMNIDRVADDVAFGQGMCGSASGSVPVNVGQPTIRISEITVGGRGGKLE